jgi:hypothetical protein
MTRSTFNRLAELRVMRSSQLSRVNVIKRFVHNDLRFGGHRASMIGRGMSYHGGEFHLESVLFGPHT